MKQTMKKRITALLLVFSLAALLSLSAFAEDASTTADPSVGAETSDATGSEAGSAGTTASGGVAIDGEVYYGTDYVQFDIHGGNATNLFYDVLYNGDPVYRHVHYEVEEDGVDHVGIEVKEGKSQNLYSIVVYTGPSAKADGSAVTANIRCLYADLLSEDGTSSHSEVIGAVVNTVAISMDDFPSTFYFDGKDYNRAQETIDTETDGYHCDYTLYVQPELTGSITYVDSHGSVVKTDQIEKIKASETEDSAREIQLKEVTAADGTVYYPQVTSIKVDYYKQIDFVIPCRTYPKGEYGHYQAIIQYVDENDELIWMDEVSVTENYIYMLPKTFVHTADVTGEDGTTQTQTNYYDRADETAEYLYFQPGDAGTDQSKTYTVQYNVVDQTREVTWTIQNLAVSVAEDGTWSSISLGNTEYTVQPGKTATHTPEPITYNGTTYVPVQDEYTYTYGDTNLLQQVYYTADGYVPSVSYTVALQFVNIADGAVLQSESVMVNPGADTEITCPAEFTAGDNTYVRLGGQSDTYRHSYYSPKRTYTIYYRDVNDTLYANTIITNIETVTTERTETGVTYVEDVTTVTGGTVTGPAYATGPAAGTGITGITDDTTGMNQAVNEEGQGLAQEREEQIAEGETPLAQSPGGETTPEESITDNDTAKSGLSTALMTGGTVAALVVAIVLVVLIVVQRKRNRSTRR